MNGLTPKHKNGVSFGETSERCALRVNVITSSSHATSHLSTYAISRLKLKSLKPSPVTELYTYSRTLDGTWEGAKRGACSPCVGAITRGGAGDAATGVFWCCSIGSTVSITASITTFVAAAIGTAVTASRLLAAVSTLSLTAPMRRLTAGT